MDSLVLLCRALRKASDEPHHRMLSSMKKSPLGFCVSAVELGAMVVPGCGNRLIPRRRLGMRISAVRIFLLREGCWYCPH